MATFTNLFHVAEAIKYVLENEIVPAPLNVVAGRPSDSVTTEELRVTLLWINEQATHRSDGFVRNPDGTSSPPPATLSLFFLVTGYGEDGSQNSDAAHRVVGEVLRLFHAKPFIELPIGGLPSNSGLGKLHVTLVPITPEIMEKLFSPIQIKHRPFLLYEVHPVQLVSTLSAGPVSPVVAPGGIRLTGPTTSTPPLLARLVPSTLAEGGYLRIDGTFSSPIDAIWIGTHRFALPGGFDVLDASRSVGVTLPAAGPDAIPPGIHRVVVMSGKLTSAPLELRVVPSGTWSVDGPQALSAAMGAAFQLTGQALDDASLVYVWPESGIFAPNDVHKIGGLVVTPTSVDFNVPNVLPGTYRVAVEIDLGPGIPLQFTPFVTLELVP